jgi:hypothetical protein
LVRIGDANHYLSPTFRWFDIRVGMQMTLDYEPTRITALQNDHASIYPWLASCPWSNNYHDYDKHGMHHVTRDISTSSSLSLKTSFNNLSVTNKARPTCNGESNSYSTTISSTSMYALFPRLVLVRLYPVRPMPEENKD